MANSNGNIKNLKPVRSKKEARERGKAGGIASGKVRRERKTFKDELIFLLENGNTQKKLSIALIKQAMKGNTKAFEIIRDTVGEKPVDKLEADVKNEINVTIE
jgi:hypothetical protein